ncbi:MAG: IS1182 family transposase [Acidobacteriota bacterium]
MEPRFKKIDRHTMFLMPPSLEDWLPENHLARFIVEIVSQLDLRTIKNAYDGRGTAAHHPSILLGLLFYGYSTGIFSSRKIERATYDSVAFRFIAANTHPDHDTIANFRKRFLDELKPLFLQILTIAHTMGVQKIGKISLDGTKVKANASKHHALSWGHANKLEEQLTKEIEELLQLAEQEDATAVPDGMDVPEEIARRQDRLAGIAKAKAEIKLRADERYLKQKQEHDEKMQRRERGNIRGKEPAPPQPGPLAKDQMNLTDPESRIMPTSSKGFEQAYNAQAAVDIDSMLIVTSHISQHPNDKQEIEPALAELSNLPEEVAQVEAILADTGYHSAANVTLCNNAEIQPVIASKRDKHNRSPCERFAEPPPLEDGVDPVGRVKHYLRTREGRRLYGRRKCTIEPVFGIIKHVLGFRQFLLRGLKAVQGEWSLVCMAWNIKRLHTITQ